MAVHAGVYGRQSKGRENGSEVSTADQLARGIEEAQHRNAESITTYEDLGISAFSGVERPDFDRLLNDCRTGRINAIIVYYVSRFSRLEPLDAIPIVTELLNLGVTIVSVTEGEFRKGNLMDLIHIIMRLDQAHKESKNKSDAVQGAKKTARSLGGYVGGKPPYGFKMVPKTVTAPNGKPIVIQTLEHDDDETSVIRRVWATIKKHMHEPYKPSGHRSHPGSLTGICKRLTADEVPTRGARVGKKTKNSVWDPKTLVRILRDPRIAGYAVEIIYKMGKNGKPTSTIQEYRIQRDPETMAPIVAHPGIIPPAEWHELQQWLDGRGRGKGLSRGQALLSAMERLYCECGSTMTSSRARNANYRCRRRKMLPGQHEGECTVSARNLDEYVARRIFALLDTGEGDPTTGDVLAVAARRYARNQEQPETAGERRSLLAEQADARKSLEELYDRDEAGDYDDPVGRKRFRKRRAQLLATLEAAASRLEELDDAETPKLPVRQWLAPDAPDVDPLGEGSWWERASITDRREFVKLFVDRIDVSKAGAHTGQGVPVRQRVAITWATEPREEEDDEATYEAAA